MEYVAGFMFNEVKTQVVLIKKNHPEWQAGYLNGVGGKMKPGETAKEAMNREFFEEAGIKDLDWELFAVLKGEWGIVRFFKTCGDVWEAHTMEEEEIVINSVEHLPTLSVIPNLRWLIPMAIKCGFKENILTITEGQPKKRMMGTEPKMSQVSAIGAPHPKTWKDYRNGCLMTFAGGHENPDNLKAFRHGMKTVFNLFESEFPPLEEMAGAVQETETNITDKCEWNNNDGHEMESQYETSCGHSFMIIEGGPAENDMKYCCYCGKEIPTNGGN